MDHDDVVAGRNATNCAQQETRWSEATCYSVSAGPPRRAQRSTSRSATSFPEVDWSEPIAAAADAERIPRRVEMAREDSRWGGFSEDGGPSLHGGGDTSPPRRPLRRSCSGDSVDLKILAVSCGSSSSSSVKKGMSSSNNNSSKLHCSATASLTASLLSLTEKQTQ
jgi:hypothetical protein